jgi:serine/threonine-protein kinase RsbW
VSGRVDLEVRGSVCVLRGGGGVGDDLAGELRSELDRCHQDGARDVVLDLDDPAYLDSAVVDVIREAALEFRDDGGELVLAVEQPEARRVLAAAGLMHVAPAAPSPGVTEAEGVSLPARPRWEHEFVFAAAPHELPNARRRVTAFAEVAGLEGADLFEFSVAVGEALANAVVHGSPHGADDDVRVHFFCFDDELAVEVIDSGPGMDVTPICAPESSASSGRGIHFMRALSDGVQYVCGPLGTHVLLIKHRD